MESAPFAAPQQPRLLDCLRDKIRLKHYSIRTEYAYTDWVRRFVLFHGKRHLRTDVRAGGRKGEKWTSRTRNSTFGKCQCSCRERYTASLPASRARSGLGSHPRCGAQRLAFQAILPRAPRELRTTNSGISCPSPEARSANWIRNSICLSSLALLRNSPGPK